MTQTSLTDTDLASVTKREIIINAWVASDHDADVDAVAAISGAKRFYVADLIDDLDAGEIAQDAWSEYVVDELVEELENRLEECNTDSGETTMSSELKSPEAVIEESTKKDRIIGAYRVSPSADKNKVADALGVSYEYTRQIFKDFSDRDQSDWEKLHDGDYEKDLSPELLDAVEQRLRETDAASAGDASGKSREMVPASEVEAVKEKVELLREQAEFTENSGAEFIALKTSGWMDELLTGGE